MYVSTITSAIAQVAFLTLIPFVVYVVTQRRARGFWRYIGIQRAPRKAVIAGAALGLVTGVAMLWVFYAPGLRELMLDPNTQTGKLAEIYTNSGLFALLFVALIQATLTTALSEEIFFRGFVTKRLIAWRGFAVGNLIQAALFGLLHLVLFFGAATPLTLARWLLVLLLPTGYGWAIGWLNEKYAVGSIAPGWAAHAIGNLITFLAVPFLYT